MPSPLPLITLSLTSKIARSLCVTKFHCKRRSTDSTANLFFKSDLNTNSFLVWRSTNLPLNLSNFGTNSPSPIMKSALVLIVDGSEEMEFTITADVLRRAGVSF